MSEQQNNLVQAIHELATQVGRDISAVDSGNVIDTTEKLDQILGLLQSSTTSTLIGVEEREAEQTPTTIAISTVPTSQYVVRVEATTENNLHHLAGMDPHTGKIIRGEAYLKQRITDAFSTPKASQVLLRDRGSDILNIIDQPQNRSGTMKAMATIAAALGHRLAGLPDFVLSRIQILSQSMDGKMGIALTGQWLGNDVEVTV